MSNYYNENSNEFISSTIDCNMADVYQPFIKYLNEGDCILDAGCGSGRDSLYFLNEGFCVNAFDISNEMVNASIKLTGIEVQQIGFLDIEYNSNFDAIWACASLLHLDRKELPIAFQKLHKSLKSGGILYCSFKLRESDFTKGDRCFTCFTKDSFTKFIEKLNIFEILEIYTTKDCREDRRDELWLNAIIRKL